MYLCCVLVNQTIEIVMLCCKLQKKRLDIFEKKKIVFMYNVCQKSILQIAASISAYYHFIKISILIQMSLFFHNFSNQWG
jgi:hypothetical protein